MSVFQVIKKSDLFPEEKRLHLLQVTERMFEARLDNSWKRDFKTFKNFKKKLNQCKTNENVNNLLNASWTGMMCNVDVCQKTSNEIDYVVKISNGNEFTTTICNHCQNEINYQIQQSSV